MDAGRVFGIVPAGLGARDTLRFEAAMPLYGHEMDETVNPYAAGLGWAVKLNKGEFVGREALREFKANPGTVRVGLALDGKRIARQGYPVKLDGRAGRRRHLGDLRADARPEPGDGLGRARGVGARHDPDRRRPRPATSPPRSSRSRSIARPATPA